jgi:hypothetical protein
VAVKVTPQNPWDILEHDEGITLGEDHPVGVVIGRHRRFQPIDAFVFHRRFDGAPPLMLFLESDGLWKLDPGRPDMEGELAFEGKSAVTQRVHQCQCGGDALPWPSRAGKGQDETGRGAGYNIDVR